MTVAPAVPVQPSLFQQLPPAPAPYPIDPGFKTGGASKVAARSLRSSKVAEDRQRILDYLRVAGPQTPDEISAALGFDILYGRPRVSELRKQGRIEKMKDTRPSSRGLPAHLMRLTQPEGTTR